MTKTEATWADRVRDWKESGKSAEDFATGQPFKGSTLRWWGTELRRRREARASMGGRGGRASGALKSIPMARVVRRRRYVDDASAEAQTSASASAMVVEVSGARITLTQGFDADLFSEVVRALGRGR
jgi:hypothetical protein